MTPSASVHTRFVFYCGLSLLLITSPLLWLEYGQLVRWVNGQHTPALDVLMRNLTYFGDGAIFVPVVLALLFVRYYYALVVSVTGLVHGLLVNFFKKIVFTDSPRPTQFFNDETGLHVVEGVRLHCWQAFPSGHTTTAFALALALALLIRHRGITLALLVLACVAGISRMYLLLHFFVDVYAGAALGMCSAALVWYGFQQGTTLGQHPRWQRALGRRPLLRTPGSL